MFTHIGSLETRPSPLNLTIIQFVGAYAAVMKCRESMAEVQSAAEESAKLLETANTEVLKEALKPLYTLQSDSLGS